MSCLSIKVAAVAMGAAVTGNGVPMTRSSKPRRGPPGAGTRCHGPGGPLGSFRPEGG